MAAESSRPTREIPLDVWHRFHRRLRSQTNLGASPSILTRTRSASSSSFLADASDKASQEAEESWGLAWIRQRSTSVLNVDPDGAVKDAPKADLVREDMVWKNQRKIEDEYEFQECIGEGSFGRVHKAVHILSGSLRAVKELPKVETLAEDFELELRALIALDHPHIVQVIEHFEEANKYFIVMEYCTGPDLFAYVVENTSVTSDPPVFIPETRISVILRQCLKAVLCCHAHGFVHRDLKAKNFLMTGSDHSVKLIDFGLATRFSPDAEYEEVVGTAHYMAPEMMLSGQWTTASDIWSLGVLFFALLTGTLLLPGDDGKKRKMVSSPHHIKARLEKCRGLRARGVSDGALDLLQKMLAYEPELRISAAQALSHPFVLAHSDEFLGRAIPSGCVLNEDVVRRMRRFARAPRLLKVSLLIMAHLATPQERDDTLERAHHVFRTIDKHGTGQVDLQTLQAQFKAQMLDAPPDLPELFKICNSSNSGRLSLSEFLACVLPWEWLDERLCGAVFNVLDRDYNGYLSAKDLQLAHPSYDTVVCEEMIAEADIKKKGFLDFEDFECFVRRVGQLKKRKSDDKDVAGPFSVSRSRQRT